MKKILLMLLILTFTFGCEKQEDKATDEELTNLLLESGKKVYMKGEFLYGAMSYDVGSHKLTLREFKKYNYMPEEDVKLFEQRSCDEDNTYFDFYVKLFISKGITNYELKTNLDCK